MLTTTTIPAAADPRRQRGAAVLMFIIVLIVALSMILGAGASLWQRRNAATDRGYQSLIDTKSALLAYAANPGMDPVAGRRIGQILLTPDLPIVPGATFDGTSKPGCATSTWAPGQALSDPSAAAVPGQVRCFGRFPWLSYGLNGPSSPDDPDGIVPWIFLSANLVANSTCVPLLNPLMLSAAYAGACGSTVPFPWLTVVDGLGNVLSAEVAVVLILPGPPVGTTQVRVAPADLSADVYLDSVTIGAGCPSPCIPGTYSNANYTLATGQAWTFVRAPSSSDLGPQPNYYTQPYAFNDRLIYITAAEYFAAMEVRARFAVTAALQQYRATNGYYPDSGDHPSAPLSNNCSSHSRFGLLGTTGACATVAYPAWLTESGWTSYFLYAVDPGCTAGSTIPRCLAPTLRLGAGATAYNAVLLSPGRAITAPPYAVSKGVAQQPIGSGSFADFLDSSVNVAGPPFDAAGTPWRVNYDDQMFGLP
jgi:hypothetical protein